MIFHEGVNHWLNDEVILNYELNAGINCKNTVASDEILKASEAKRLKDEEERKVKEELAKKQEE